MNAILPTLLNVDEFMRWLDAQDSSRYELERGRIFAMQAENHGHAKLKARLYVILCDAIQMAGVAYFAASDGPRVQIANNRSYEPDATIAPLPEISDDALEIPNPVVVFEVMSPTPASMRRDLIEKAVGYAKAPTIEHYIVIDPAERVVLHFRRRGDLLAPAEAPVEGVLRLDPPGIEVPIEAIFPALSRPAE